MYIRILLLLNAFFLLTCCAFVNTEILEEANICLAPNSNYQIEVISRETVIGSYHTPFDYGNKSISDHIFTFQISTLNGELEFNQIKTWLNSETIIAKSGSLRVSNNKLYINLHFEHSKLRGKVLFSSDHIKKCTNAL